MDDSTKVRILAMTKSKLSSPKEQSNGHGKSATMQYHVGGQAYYQLPASCGQMAYLLDALASVDWFCESQTELFAKILRHLPTLASLVLIPKGSTREEFEEWCEGAGNLDARRRDFKSVLRPDQGVKIAKDFFTFNDVPEITKQVEGMIDLVVEQQPEMPQTPLLTPQPQPTVTPTTSTVSSPSSVEATPPNATESKP